MHFQNDKMGHKEKEICLTIHDTPLVPFHLVAILCIYSNIYRMEGIFSPPTHTIFKSLLHHQILGITPKEHEIAAVVDIIVVVFCLFWNNKYNLYIEQLHSLCITYKMNMKCYWEILTVSSYKI